MTQSPTKSFSLFATLAMVGWALEGLTLLVATWWSARYSHEAASLGPVLFGVALLGLFLAGQLVAALFRLDLVAGMSLALLAAMLAWLAAIGVVLALFFLIILAIYSLGGIPLRLLWFAWHRVKASRPRLHAGRLGAQRGGA